MYSRSKQLLTSLSLIVTLVFGIPAKSFALKSSGGFKLGDLVATGGRFTGEITALTNNGYAIVKRRSESGKETRVRIKIAELQKSFLSVGIPITIPRNTNGATTTGSIREIKNGYAIVDLLERDPNDPSKAKKSFKNVPLVSLQMAPEYIKVGAQAAVQRANGDVEPGTITAITGGAAKVKLGGNKTKTIPLGEVRLYTEPEYPIQIVETLVNEHQIVEKTAAMSPLIHCPDTLESPSLPQESSKTSATRKGWIQTYFDERSTVSELRNHMKKKAEGRNIFQAETDKLRRRIFSYISTNKALSVCLATVTPHITGEKIDIESSSKSIKKCKGVSETTRRFIEQEIKDPISPFLDVIVMSSLKLQFQNWSTAKSKKENLDTFLDKTGIRQIFALDPAPESYSQASLFGNYKAERKFEPNVQEFRSTYHEIMSSKGLDENQKIRKVLDLLSLAADPVGTSL